MASRRPGDKSLDTFAGACHSLLDHRIAEVERGILNAILSFQDSDHDFYLIRGILEAVQRLLLIPPVHRCVSRSSPEAA